MNKLSLVHGFSSLALPYEQSVFFKVFPVFKDGDCHDFNNYRQISLLSSFSKLFEKVVAKQLLIYLHINYIIYKHQYGFRAGHKAGAQPHPRLQLPNGNDCSSCATLTHLVLQSNSTTYLSFD